MTIFDTYNTYAKLAQAAYINPNGYLDVNGDGISQAGELKTLESVGYALTDANPARPLGQAPTLDADVFDLPWLCGYGFVKSLLARWTGLSAAHTAKGVTRTDITLEDKVWMLEALTGQNVDRQAIEAANFGSIRTGVDRLLSRNAKVGVGGMANDGVWRTAA